MHEREGQKATVVVDGEWITGTIYHMRDNGWPCVETEAGRVASGPEKCEWFALCDRLATGTTPHPVLGSVPTCDRCHKFATED